MTGKAGRPRSASPQLRASIIGLWEAGVLLHDIATQLSTEEWPLTENGVLRVVRNAPVATRPFPSASPRASYAKGIDLSTVSPEDVLTFYDLAIGVRRERREDWP